MVDQGQPAGIERHVRRRARLHQDAPGAGSEEVRRVCDHHGRARELHDRLGEPHHEPRRERTEQDRHRSLRLDEAGGRRLEPRSCHRNRRRQGPGRHAWVYRGIEHLHPEARTRARTRDVSGLGGQYVAVHAGSDAHLQDPGDRFPQGREARPRLPQRTSIRTRAARSSRTTGRKSGQSRARPRRTATGGSAKGQETSVSAARSASNSSTAWIIGGLPFARASRRASTSWASASRPALRKTSAVSRRAPYFRST